MSSVSNGIPFDSEEYISLYDIWKKVVRYKRVYWVAFFTLLVIGVGMVLLLPVKYEFTQVFKVGRYANYGDKDVDIQQKELRDFIANIKLIYAVEALRKYNSRSAKKINPKNYKLDIKDAGDGVFVLSAVATRENMELCRFIFQEIGSSIHNDVYSDVEFRIKNLAALKKNLETRLHDLNFLYTEMLKNGFSYSTAQKTAITAKTDIAFLEGKIISMYLNDQQTVAVNLTNNLNLVQAQINNAYGVKTVADFTVSEFPAGLSKLALFILVVMGALFFGFFGVVIANFIVNYKEKFRLVNGLK